MKIYYIKNNKCKDITVPVSMITSGIGLVVISLATPMIVNTATMALVKYEYATYCKEVYNVLDLGIKALIPLRM